MRILVISDSHGDYRAVRDAALSQMRAEVIIHCGDGESEAESLRRDFPDKAVYCVKGNCDWGSRLPVQGELCIEGKKIIYTHGHAYSVKSGYAMIKQEARQRGADILLFGHTHTPLNEYEDGLYIMNPGSIRSWNASYGIIDITDKGIMTNIVHI